MQASSHPGEDSATPALNAGVKLKIIAEELERLGQPGLAEWAREVKQYIWEKSIK